MVKICVVDSQGRAVPNSSNEIQFAIDGPGRIIGVGNGDPSSHEPDKFIDQVQSFAIGDWRMSKIDDTKNRPETAEHFDDASWRSVFTHRDDNQPRQRVSTDAVYRGDVEMPAINPASTMSLLLRRFGDEQWVYLNGKPIAHISDDDHLAVDLHPDDFHAGKNVIAVVATPRHGNREQMSRDETLNPSVRVITSAGTWKRSLFAGLAQVIVQTTQQSGQIKLTATCGGLTAGTLELQSNGK
jgi:beta-galactosidase